MTQEIKERCAALNDWAEQDDSKRAVLCVIADKDAITDEGYRIGVLTAVNGQASMLFEMLIEAMKRNECFADIICKAVIAYTIIKKHAAIDVKSVNGEEANNG